MKSVKKEEVIRMMKAKYPKLTFDKAVNEAKKDYLLVTMRSKKKYAVMESLIKEYEV